MNLIEQQLSERLKATFKQYVRHAIAHSLSDEPCENDILQVIVNLQASLELLSKFYVLQSKGWKGIVDPRYHSKPEADVLAAIESGTLRTTSYQKNKDFITREIFLTDDDKDLLDSFHHHRNQVMHLGVVNPSRDILNESIWFIVRIINQLNWQDMLPMDKQYLSNSLEFLLEHDLYNNLISNSCYVDEAIDRAYEISKDVKFCIQCGNESWALKNDGYRICQVCGYRGDEDAFGFIDCPECKAEGALLYDPLNIGANTFINGKCCVCKKIIPVCQCPQCEAVYRYPGICELCQDKE